MRLSKIERLVRLMEKSDIEELEFSNWLGQRLRITKRIQKLTENQTAQENKTTIVTPSTPLPEERPEKIIPIKSPMVGTFYRAPAPDAKPYTEVGQTITTGQIVCVIEAMKLMNEIESEVTGEVKKILVENGKPVEWGQKLFLIKVIK